MVAGSEHQSVLARVFAGLPPEALADMAAQASASSYPDGHRLCVEGQVEDVFYVLIEGRVSIRSDEQVVGYREKGEYFGEMGLVHGEARSADVVAEGPVRVLELNSKGLDELMKKRPEAAMAITRLTLRELRRQQTTVNKLLLKPHLSREKPKVFVSYARADVTFVATLVRDLQAAGTDLWFDREHIQPGSNWDDAIDAALNDCDMMLLVLSPAAMESDNVKSEWQYFLLNLQRPVLPVVYKACKIPHRRLANLQRIELFDLEYETAIGMITRQIEKSPVAGRK